MNTLNRLMVITALTAGFGLRPVAGQDEPARDERAKPPPFMKARYGGGGPPGGGKWRAGERPFEKEREAIEQFREESPEKYEELMRLREESPEEFRREVGKLFGRRFGQGKGEGGGFPPPEEAEIRRLAEQYHTAGSDADRAALKAKLKEAVERQFDARLKEREKRLVKMEEQLARVRAMLEERKAHRGDICEAHIRDLTTDPKLRWNTKW